MGAVVAEGPPLRVGVVQLEGVGPAEGAGGGGVGGPRALPGQVGHVGRARLAAVAGVGAGAGDGAGGGGRCLG